jgi:hypothetical protein
MMASEPKALTREEFASLLAVGKCSVLDSPAVIPAKHSARLVGLGYVVDSKEFPGQILLTMKAFPLEYEGRAPIDAPSHAGLLSRQKAMIRYYRQQFGVTPFRWPIWRRGLAI